MIDYAEKGVEITKEVFEAIEYLPNEELRLEAVKGYCEYGFYGNVPSSNNPNVQEFFDKHIPSKN